MGSLFSFLIVIGIIIFIHESGHFSMAKIFGIPVSTFSLGFGPRLFGFKRKETDYRLSAIPLGGYVKIHGMEDQEADPNDPNSFYNRPRWQRFLVLFMGVGFNFLLAIILITTALTLGFQVGQSNGLEGRIGYVSPGSPAAQAAIQPGDVIVEMNGKKTDRWQNIVFATLLNPEQDVEIVLRRGDQTLTKTVHLTREKVNNLGYLGVTPETDVIILGLEPGKPAQKAGLKENDLIKSINGIELHSPEPEAAQSAVQKSEGKPVAVRVERVENGQKVTSEFSITPVFDDKMWRVGFFLGEPTKLKKLPFRAALVESFRTCREHIQLNAIYIYKLFQGKLTLKATSGPFQIAALSQAARKTGLSTFLLFIGTVSFDIGLINLLPIPALDGGHLFFLVVEGITRREFSIKMKERITTVGFVFLVCVMVMVLYYDVLKTGPGQWLFDRLGSR